MIKGDNRDLTEKDLAGLDHLVAVKISYPLTKIPGLKVAGRLASFYWHNKGIQSTEIGEKLGVENILEFSVQNTESRRIVTAQLIKVSDSSKLWSERYDLETGEFSAILKETLQAISKKLQVNLTRKHM